MKKVSLDQRARERDILTDFPSRSARWTKRCLIAVLVTGAVSAIVTPSPSHAFTPDWNGFVSAIGTRTSENLGMDDGVGPDLNFSNLSRFGLTASGAINSDWDAYIEVLGANPADRDIPVLSVDYALLNWHAKPNTLVRVGRLRMPFWLISDHKSVGALYPWVRPPVEVYSQSAITSANGVSAAQSFSLGGGNATLEAIAAGGAVDVTSGYKTRLISDKDVAIAGLAADWKLDRFRFHISNFLAFGRFNIQTKFNLSIDTNGDSVADTPVQYTSTTALDLGRLNFLSAGAQFNLGNFEFWTEFADLRAQLGVEQRTSAYGTIGYTFENLDLTTLLTYSSLIENKFSNTRIGSGTQESYSITLKHALTPEFIMKAEWTQTRFKNGWAMARDLDSTTSTPGVAGKPNSVNIASLGAEATF